MTALPELDAKEGKSTPQNVLTPLDMLGFAARAARRHWRLGSSIALGTVALGVAYSMGVSQKFSVTSRILADEMFNKTEALSTPDRAMPNLNPFSGSLELLTQRSVLASIVEKAGLIADVDSRQSPFMREVNAYIDRTLGREMPTFEERRDSLARGLVSNIKLGMSREVVTISVIWPNPHKAVEIARLLDEKFIELLRNRETASFSAAISILEDEARRAGEAIEPALAEAVRERDQSDSPAPPAPTPAASQVRRADAAPRVPDATSDTAAVQARQFSVKLAEVNARIQTAEAAWRNRQDTANARLAELKTVYGPAHPQIIQQQTHVDAASVPPADLVELQRKRAELLSEIQNVPAEGSQASAPRSRTARRPTGVAQSERLATPLQATAAAPGPNENFEVTAARAKLNHAVENFNNVQRRLESARLQLTASQATFGMHFVVVEKPELPTGPTKPMRKLVRIAALVAGLLLGSMAGAVRDLISGKIHEPLQLKPYGLKDLGELPIFDATER